MAGVATAHNTTAEVWNLAQTDGKLSKAWGRKDRIGEDYSIKYSPVRNAHVREVTLKYANLEVDSSGNETDASVGVTDQVYRGGTAVALSNTPTAPDSNHIFLGWTNDKTGASKPFLASLPDEVYEEDATIYAMWGVPTDTATPVIDAESDLSATAWAKFTATQGKAATSGAAAVVGSASIYYSKDKPLKFKADLKVKTSIMSDPVGVYTWTYQENSSAAEQPLVGASAVYDKAKTVADSGIYKYTYTYYSKSEPLWRASGTGASINATINPAPLKVQSFTIVSGEHAYDGMRYQYLTPNPTVLDTASGNTVM
ncbi:MAG: hypothetical protein K2N18_03010, partial [Clostridia bacterium]|nr:hypothetical protein [Clostridia bacterium]